MTAPPDAVEPQPEPKPEPQPQPQPTPSRTEGSLEMTTAQVRRIAEALDGYRTGDHAFVVIQADGDSPLAAQVVGGTREEAEAVATAMRAATGRSFAVEGPFKTDRDATLDRDLTLGYAVVLHEPTTHSRRLPVGFFGSLDEVREIWLEFHREGHTEPTRVRLAEGNQASPAGAGHMLPPVDAVFFSFAAVDKFMMPYYARLYGVAEATEIRRILAEAAKESFKFFREGVEPDFVR